MKKKSRKARLKRKKEFRFHKVEIVSKEGKEHDMWHPTYIFLEKGNVYIYVSITHSSIVENKLLIKLSNNPNPNDKRESYWVVEIREDTKDTFSRRLNGWIMSEFDDNDIRSEYEKKKDDSADRT